MTVYRASDAVDNEAQLDALAAAAEELGLDHDARRTAEELYLSTAPDADRSKPAAVAASLYAGARIAGDGRSQRAVAEAVGVSRIAVQRRWRPLLEEAGLEAPSW